MSNRSSRDDFLNDKEKQETKTSDRNDDTREEYNLDEVQRDFEAQEDIEGRTSMDRVARRSNDGKKRSALRKAIHSHLVREQQR
jgi:hypothetical protein